MSEQDRFQQAMQMIDEANAQDPRIDRVGGQDVPRELHFSQQMHTWIRRLRGDPSEALLLAGRAFAIRRWMIPRDQYAMNTVGYHKWRTALAEFHANEAATILESLSYPSDMIAAIKDLITKKNFPADPDACAVEDASCLAFLESKLADYLDTWDHDKMLRILSGTIRKMSSEARQLALGIDLTPRAQELVKEAYALATT